MKKQIKKLSLNKKTISNLTAAEMNRAIGGNSGSCGGGSCWCTEFCPGPQKTKNGNTCPGHKTCYTS